MHRNLIPKTTISTHTLVPTAIAIALPLALVVQQPVQALSFRLDFDRRVPDAFQAATQEAADAWSAVLKDDVVVDLRIEYEDLSSAGAVLGGAQPGKVKVKYEDYASALFNDAISANDLSAVNSLPLSSEGRQAAGAFQLGDEAPKKDKLKSDSFAFLLDGRFGGNRSAQPFVDSNRSANNKNVLLTRAQAKALGLEKNGSLDGLIKINSSVEWDTDRSDGVASDRYDAASVMQHEIGHILGIVSGADALGFIAAASEPIDLDKNSFSYLTPIDLHRYSAESAELGVADLTLGGSEKYFSLDGGASAVTNEKGQSAYFATGSESDGGDGYQSSHWRLSSDPLGVTSALLRKGQSIDISELDLTLLDSVGWDTEDNSAQRAAKLGLDWQQLTGELAQQKSALTDSLAQQWSSQVPGFSAALADASVELDLAFQEKFRKEFNELVKKSDEGKLKDRGKEIAKFKEKVQKEADKRNDKIRDLPKEIYKIDEKVNKWLTLSTDKLSKKVKDANGSEINRLSNLVKAAPAEQRAELEPKLEAAFAQFSDSPDKLLEELLDSSGPSNPFPWGRNFRTWWYLQLAESLEDSSSENVNDPGLLYATGNYATGNLERNTDLDKANSASDRPTAISSLSPLNPATVSLNALGDGEKGTTDIPEPSSVLALFGIAVLGLGATRRKK